MSNALLIVDFLKVVRLVFWSGVVRPGSCRSLALRAHSRATRSKARLVSKSNQNAEKQDHNVEVHFLFSVCFAVRNSYMLGASIRDLRPPKLIHEERLLPKSTIRKNKVHFRPVLITFLIKHDCNHFMTKTLFGN